MSVNPNDLREVVDSLWKQASQSAVNRGLIRWVVEERLYDEKPCIVLRWKRTDDIFCNIHLLVEEFPPFRSVRISANAWVDRKVDKGSVEQRFWKEVLSEFADTEDIEKSIEEAIRKAESVHGSQLTPGRYLAPLPHPFAPA